MRGHNEFSADRLARARMIAEREQLEKGRISDAYNYLAGGAQKFTEGVRNIGADIKAGQAARKEIKATNKDQRDFDAMTPDAQANNPNYVQDMANKRQRELGAAQNLAAQNALAPPQLANQNQAQNQPAQNQPAQNQPAQNQPAQNQPAPAPHIPGLGMFQPGGQQQGGGGGGQQQQAPQGGGQQGGGQQQGGAPAPAPQQGGGAPAPAPAAGGNQMQNAAQQMAFGADAAALARGKGGEQQSWMKNRSLGGKVADVLSMGLTANMGQTRYGARRQANQKSKEQTDRYNLANQNMAMRAAGMQPQQLKFASAERIHNSIEHILLRKQIGR